MTGFTPIDLSKLPAPDVIQTVAFDVLFAEMKAEAVRQMPELQAFLALESEPVTKLLRVCAYLRMLDRLAFNDGARANMLALATGADLDGLAVYWGVERLIVQAANNTVSPAVLEIKETDAAFRARVQLSLEGHTTAGPRGSYIFWALSASGDVKDASVQSPMPGEVLVSVLSNSGNGTPSNALLSAVETALNDEDVRPLTDDVSVQGATILDYSVDASLILYSGPDPDAVLELAQEQLLTYIQTHHRLGHDITRSGLLAALHQPGVQNVILAEPNADIVVGPSEAAFCAPDSVQIAIGGTNV